MRGQGPGGADAARAGAVPLTGGARLSVGAAFNPQKGVAPTGESNSRRARAAPVRRASHWAGAVLVFEYRRVGF